MKHLPSTLLVAAVLALGALSIQSCHDPNAPQTSNAMLTGIDFRACAAPCCGGWFVTIDGTSYRFTEWPEENDLQPQDLPFDAFPIPVRIQWETDPIQCAEDRITVYSIELR